VLLDDFVDVGLVDVGIPDSLWVDDDHRTFIATVHASGLVDPHLAFSLEAEFADAVLGIGAKFARAAVVAACLAVLALVAAEKYMSFVVAHDRPCSIAEL